MSLGYLSKIFFSLLVLSTLAGVAGCGDKQSGANAAVSDPEHEEHQTGETAESHGGGQDESGQEVHLSDKQASLLSIEVGEAKAGTADALVSAPATVRFDSDRVAMVGPRLEAKVVKVVKDLGERVEAGEVVAVLDSVTLGQAKARYLTAAARHESALAEYRRDKKLSDRQIVSESELLDSKAVYLETKAERDAARAELRLYGLDERAIDNIAVGGEQPLSRYVLTAPLGGIVQRRDLMPGQTISAQETPIQIVNTGRMWVMLEAAEKAVPQLATGLPATFRTRALPGQTFAGKTDWVSRELDPESRTLTVRAVVDNPDGRLRAGMSGTAVIQTDSAARYALVPVDTVQRIGKESLVFVPGDEPGAFRATPVILGNEGDGVVEIRDGLQPGQPVVVHGAFDLMSALTASGRSASHGH